MQHCQKTVAISRRIIQNSGQLEYRATRGMREWKLQRRTRRGTTLRTEPVGSANSIGKRLYQYSRA